MGIDLDSTEGRKEYLSDKLDDLLEGINDSYGTILMEELLTRLELTVKDFNDEMKVLCEQLVVKEKERQQLLEMLKATEGMASSKADEGTPPLKSEAPAEEAIDMQNKKSVPVQTDEADEDIPEWEKKLAKLEKT